MTVEVDPVDFGEQKGAIRTLTATVQRLEEKVDLLLAQHHQNTGMMKVAKWLPGALAGLLATLGVEWIKKP